MGRSRTTICDPSCSIETSLFALFNGAVRRLNLDFVILKLERWK